MTIAKLRLADVDTEAHLKKFQKELSSGTVALVLLAVLAQTDEPMYGYQIAKRLEHSADGALERQAERAVSGAAQSECGRAAEEPG